MRRIGLTGGIGSGKSTVAALLQTRGAAVIDADAIARALTAPGGAALPAIIERFGPSAVGADGAMDRAHMRDVVFQDPEAKRDLEDILHPMIAAATRDAALAVPAGQPIVFDIPLLVESLARWRPQLDRILVIDCSEDTQIERVMRRNGWTAPAVRRIIAQQAGRDQRRAAADAVITNDGIGLDELEAEIERVWTAWMGTPGARGSR